MDKKIKIIKIAHCSHSYFLGEGEEDLKKLVLNDWYSKFSKQIKEYSPEIEIECWAPEKLEKKETEFYESGVKFRFFPTAFSPLYALDFSPAMLRELKKEIKKSKKEKYKLIIHIHEVHNLHGLLILTLFNKENFVVQHHGGSWPLKHLKQTQRYQRFSLFFFLAQLWENLVLKNVDNFFVLSKEEMNYLKKVAPNSKVRFQTMGIENIYFEDVEKKIARKKLNLNQKKKIVLFLGRINETKGLRYLIDAMEKLKKEDIELKIGGFGKEQKKFEDYAKSKNLNNIEFLGGIFGEKKLLYLSSADVLVLPSLKEGAPVVIMEALAKNVPVVSTNVGGVSLMIKDKREGVLIKTENSDDIVKGIKEVLKWKNKNIKKYAERYQWKKIIEDTIKDYKNFD